MVEKWLEQHLLNRELCGILLEWHIARPFHNLCSFYVKPATLLLLFDFQSSSKRFEKRKELGGFYFQIVSKENLVRKRWFSGELDWRRKVADLGRRKLVLLTAGFWVSGGKILKL